MLVATVIFLPIILAYTAWVYKVLWGKVSGAPTNELRSVRGLFSSASSSK